MRQNGCVFRPFPGGPRDPFPYPGPRYPFPYPGPRCPFPYPGPRGGPWEDY